MINGAKEAFDACKTALVDVADCQWLARENYANSKPPRFVWVPGGGDISCARATGRNPRLVGQIEFSIAVVCWGADDDDAWRLMSALLTVVPRALKGRNYDVGKAAYTNPSWVTLGVSITVELKLVLTIPEFDFDGVAAPGGEPGVRTLRTVSPTTAEPEAIALSVPGDNILESNES